MSAATIAIDWPISRWPNPNRDRKKHWTRQRREAAALRATAADLTRLARIQGHASALSGPVKLTIALAFPDSRRRDLENYSSKAVVDGVVDAGLIGDDDATTLVAVTRTPDPERTPKGYMRMTLHFEEVES